MFSISTGIAQKDNGGAIIIHHAGERQSFRIEAKEKDRQPSLAVSFDVSR
jgi:hypothetical protein